MSDHDASSSALGYLGQVKWALLELVIGLQTRPDQALTLETLVYGNWHNLHGMPVGAAGLRAVDVTKS